MYLKVGDEIDYKRVVLEFDRYLKETKLIYAISVFAVMEDIKVVWEEIKKGEFCFMEEKK